MAPFITRVSTSMPPRKGFHIRCLSWLALMRFPTGVLAYHIGRKNAAMVEMGLIVLALAFGYFVVGSYSHVLAMGVLLGRRGELWRGVELWRWYRPHKGLAMARRRWATATACPVYGRWRRSLAGRRSTASPPSPCCCRWR